MDEIKQESIREFDVIWHKMIRIFQNKSEELWQDKLKGVSTIEISVLSIIGKNPEIILKEIIEILGVPGSTLTNVIDRLERRGLVRRVISKRDRRSFGLELTEYGREAQFAHKAVEKVFFEKILSSYETEKERKDLITLLNKLVDNLSD